MTVILFKTTDFYVEIENSVLQLIKNVGYYSNPST